MNIRNADASVLIREIKRRKLHLQEEKAALIKRIEHIDDQLAKLADVDIKGSVKDRSVRAVSLTEKKGRNNVLEVLAASSKPMSSKEVDNRLRKKMPAIDNRYTSKALSALYKQGLVTRVGPRNMFRYKIRSSEPLSIDIAKTKKPETKKVRSS